MTALVIFHAPTTFGHPRSGLISYRRLQKRDVIDLRPGRKVVLGQRTMFRGLARRVLGVGYEGDQAVVHLSVR